MPDPTTAPHRRPTPVTPSGSVLDAFGISDCASVPVRPAGADSEHWPARLAGRDVLVRWDAYPDRPLRWVTDQCAASAAAAVPVPTPNSAYSAAGPSFVVTDAAGDWTCWDRIAGNHPDLTVASAERAGALLRRIHDRSVRLRAPRPAPALIRWLPELANVDAGAARRLCGLGGGSVPCHTDLHAGNIIDDGIHMWAIDWVDGGIADAHFDVAVCAAYWGGDVGAEAAIGFIDSYFAGTTRSLDCTAVADAAKLLRVRSATFASTRVERLDDLLGDLA